MTPTLTLSRKALLAGAACLVGGFLLEGLLADERVAEVHALVRRPLRVSQVSQLPG